MSSFITMLVLVELIHVFLHLPLLFSLLVVAVIWLIWKLKYFILALVGLEFLLSRDSKADE